MRFAKRGSDSWVALFFLLDVPEIEQFRVEILASARTRDVGNGNARGRGGRFTDTAASYICTCKLPPNYVPAA
jgi:hypothetical protein